MSDFVQAIKELSESQYMPNANILFEKCSQISIRNISEVVQYVYEDEYFHQGIERLSDEHTSRNFNKAMMLIEKRIIPSFLKEDMQEYMFKNKQAMLKQNDKLQIKFYLLQSLPRVDR